MGRQHDSVDAFVSVRTQESRAAAPRPAGRGPFRLLVVGDFSGSGRGELATRRPLRVDRDDLEGRLATLAPELSVPTCAEGLRLTLAPRSLDDLHPDTLWQTLDVFERLRSLRRRLSDPHTFARAAEELGRPSAQAEAGPPRAAPRDGGAGGGLLDAALAATEGRGDERASELVDALVRELVIPRIPATPGQAELVRSVDETAAEEMRALLAAPELRRTEAAWRAAELLVRRVETDEELQVWILDVAAEELVGDLVAHEDPRAGAVWRAAFEPDAADGAPRWAAWTALDLRFGATVSQLALLSRVGRLAQAADAPFLGAAEESLVGCSSLVAQRHPDEWSAPAPEVAAAWQVLRASPQAAWLLLALPRLLLRSPYGERNNPLERFAFEELGTPPEHERFLWGSGALAPALALAQEFTRSGWGLSTARVWELDRLPIPVFRDADGELAVQPCAETVLTDGAREALESAGLLALSAVRDADRLRFGPLLSIAGTPLAGRWKENA